MSALLDRTDLRREQILEAAERVFAAKGYFSAGIADIAARLGIGHGTFYRYFKNKHDIALKVFDRVVARCAEVGLRENPEASDSIEAYRAQVERILDGFLAMAESDRALVRLLHEQWPSIDAPRFRQMRAEYAAYTERFLRNGVTKGFLRSDLDVEVTAEMLVALIFEGSRRALDKRDPNERRRWRDAGLSLMFDGIAKPPADVRS